MTSKLDPAALPAWTKGPWMRDGIKVTTCAPAAEPRLTLAIVSPNIKVGVRESYRQMHSNARLMASAPDLYEALEAILAEAANMSMTMRRRKIFDRASAALAKARGQQS